MAVMLQAVDILPDCGTDLGDAGIRHQVGDFLREAEFVQADQECLRFAGKLQQGGIMPGLAGLEHGFGFGVEADDALGAEMRHGMVEFRSGAGDDADPAGKGGQLELFYLFRRDGFSEHAAI